MKVLVTGSNGQLGRTLRSMSKGESTDFIWTDLFPSEGVDALDISDVQAVTNKVSENSIEVIINCAGYTDVEKAESEEDAAFKVNAESVAVLAEVANKANAVLIHISTDYVFDGNSSTPYGEDAVPAPLSAYGRSKLAGELALFAAPAAGPAATAPAAPAAGPAATAPAAPAAGPAATAPAPAAGPAALRHILIRTSWLYSPYGKNFVKTILNKSAELPHLSVVCDQIGTPTFAGDLAGFILHLLTPENLSKSGIYHYTNEGVCSWYDLAFEVCKLSGHHCEIRPCKTGEYPVKAARPQYSVLDKTKAKSVFGIEIPHWKDSLRHCLSLILQ